MPLFRPSSVGRFRPEALFRPDSLAVFGAGSTIGAEVMGNLLRGGYGGSVLPVTRMGRAVSGVLAYPDLDSLPLAPDLAIFADAAPTGAELQALAARDIFAAICLRSAPDQDSRDRVPGMRVLGPHAFGLCVPAIGLNASTAHLQPRAGRVALVSQSASLCRAVLDWAEPNGVGFSHVVGLGVGANTSLTMTLDWLARDPGTGAILLDVRTVRDRRSFLSAARAAARLRPVVAIHAGGRLSDPSGFGDQVFDAALRRAGVIRVTRLSDLLAAAETLTRARPAASERLAIVTNAVGPGQMAADAAIASGLRLPEPVAVEPAAGSSQAVTAASADGDPRQGRFADGIVWTGTAGSARIADAAADAAGLPGVGGVLAIVSPQRDAAAALAGLAALPARLRVPVLACALGETTGAAHRRSLAEAGVPAFATPESAVRGFEHLVMNRRARAAAKELPSSALLELHPDRERVRCLLAAAHDSGEDAVADGMVEEVLGAYGFVLPQAKASVSPAQISVRIADDPVFGPAIGVAADRRSRAQDTAWDLPPLNLALASSLVSRADAAGALVRLSHGDGRQLADALVRLSQLVVDTPRLGSFEATLRFGADGLAVCDAVLRLRRPGDASRLAIAPYPEELIEYLQAGAETLTIRPIRPEDAEAHAALFKRLTPEDVRYRFFSALRDLAPEQVVRMTQVDYDREIAFVAVRDEPGPQHGQTVGVARLVREGYADGGDAWGEFAVLVQSDMKGKGVGRRLMQRIEEWGRTQGLAGIEGQILAENAPMLAFIRSLGYQVRRMDEEPDVVEARRLLQ